MTAASHSARQTAERFSLPLRRGGRLRGGQIEGRGDGSSIDFRDHRPYMPGDDPRHIDWAAYARSGQYFLKLYADEVRPLVDLALDSSGSMGIGDAKAGRCAELSVFCAESARRAAASLRIFAVGSGEVEPVDAEDLTRAYPQRPGNGEPPDLAAIPWRSGSLRVWVSDLLYAASPRAVIAALLSGRGRAVIFSPWSSDEAHPGWEGNLLFNEPESGATADRLIRSRDRESYRGAYRRHFAAWEAECRRAGIPLARIPDSESLPESLARHALPRGAVELLR